MTTRREFLSRSAVAALMAAGMSAAGADPQTPSAQVKSGQKIPLPTCRIPHTDLEVTRLAYGCALLGVDWNGPEFLPTAVRMIQVAYDQGITFFDLSEGYGYGKAETALGEVLKQSPGLRHKIVIQSKCDTQSGVIDNSRQQLLNSVDRSLKHLGTEHLDVVLIHQPDSLTDPQEIARAFDELHRSGKVRFFGVSNYSRERIELLQKYVRQPLVANQIPLGLGFWERNTAVVEFCRAQGIQVQAYSPLRAAYAGQALNLLRLPADAPPQAKQLGQVLEEVAKSHGVTPAAIMLAWLLRPPIGIVPILGAVKPEHLIEDCAAVSIRLSHEEWYSLLDAAVPIQA